MTGATRAVPQSHDVNRPTGVPDVGEGVASSLPVGPGQWGTPCAGLRVAAAVLLLEPSDELAVPRMTSIQWEIGSLCFFSMERVLTDNAMAYRESHAWRPAMTDLVAQQEFTRSHRPQTNGEAERFNRVLADERAHIRPFDSSADRAAVPGWLHTYDHHRSHTARHGQPSISRATVNTVWALQRENAFFGLRGVGS